MDLVMVILLDLGLGLELGLELGLVTQYVLALGLVMELVMHQEQQGYLMLFYKQIQLHVIQHYHKYQTP